MIKEAIDMLVNGRSLTFEQAAKVMDEIMSGEATPAQFGALVTALRCKGETVDEIAGFASIMRAKSIKVPVKSPVIDTCGTGGDDSGSFNISTAAAFVAAGAGLKVAKHGNRAMSSRSGSADVLEALGVKVTLSAESVARCIDEAGIGFIFAQSFHPAMKYAAAPRKEIGIRTVFNMLGPLTNPAGAERQVVGVASAELGAKMAAALNRLGAKRAMVVHGAEGMDELSLCGASTVWEVEEGKVLPPKQVSPEMFGLIASCKADLAGGTPEENARKLRAVLAGEKGAPRDVVVMNAAAAIAVGNHGGIKDSIPVAQDSIDSGRARQKLEALVSLSQELN